MDTILSKSVGARPYVVDMNRNDPQTTARVFSDPVTYLAQFGIEAELVSAEELPLAA